MLWRCEEGLKAWGDWQTTGEDAIGNLMERVDHHQWSGEAVKQDARS